MLSIVVGCRILFFLMIRRPPRSTRTDTLLPYTTLFRSTSMGRILLSALSADLREEWPSHTVLEPRTERTIVSADALRAELDIVAEQRRSLEIGRAHV